MALQFVAELCLKKDFACTSNIQSIKYIVTINTLIVQFNTTKYDMLRMVLGKSLHGDPAAALLEVLDEQNWTFVDQYPILSFTVYLFA